MKNRCSQMAGHLTTRPTSKSSLQTAMLVMTSTELEKDNSLALTLGALKGYIRMRLLMLTLQGWLMDEYWY
jgi:hypothetical protein